jgi:UDP-glucose 4-epimerase
VLAIDDAPPGSVRFPADVNYQRMRLPNPALASLVRAAPPTACIHCAGRASVPHSLEDPASDFHGNTVLTFELLETLRRHAPACRVIFLSSAAVYGNPPRLPVSEDQTPAPLSPYGYHKLQCELLCAEYARLFALPTAVVRIFSAYGPGLKRQVVWDICRRALAEGRLRLHGTGDESRDFIHARDIARAFFLLAESGAAAGDIYNLSSGREVTIAELAGLLCAELAPGIAPEFDGHATPGDPRNWRADISKIAQLGFTPEIALEDGLREVARWSRQELGKA